MLRTWIVLKSSYYVCRNVMPKDPATDPLHWRRTILDSSAFNIVLHLMNVQGLTIIGKPANIEGLTRGCSTNRLR